MKRFAILTLPFAMLACVANAPVVANTIANATPAPTANVVCVSLRGAATVRDANGHATAWLVANTPVCVVSGAERRVWLADGAGTVLRACVFGPARECK